LACPHSFRRTLTLCAAIAWAGLAPGAFAHDVAPNAGLGGGIATGDIHFTNARGHVSGENHSNAVLYFSVENTSDTVHLINHVSSPSCGAIDASSAMEQPGNPDSALFTHLALPAKTTLVFPPGGFHLLCRGLAADHGSALTVTFGFLQGGTEQLTFNLTPPR